MTNIARAVAEPRQVKVGLIGSGIQASKSPALHEREARRHGLDYVYELIDMNVRGCSLSALPELLAEAEAHGYAGVNITFPAKQAIIPFLTDLSEEARALGAVNTVVFDKGKRTGHNTDWYGFHENFRLGLPDVPRDYALMIGAGGAGAAVAHAALTLGVKHLAIYDQDATRSESLAQKLNNEFSADRASSSSDLAAAMSLSAGLINATPIGMVKHPGLPLDDKLLEPRHWVADVVYMPLETELLALARGRGCRTLDGGGMAVYQAAAALKLFAEIEPDAGRMRAHFNELAG